MTAIGTALTGWNGIKVRAVCPDGVKEAALWRVDLPDGPEIHESVRSLLATLGVPAGWSFDRCFGLGRWSPSPMLPEPERLLGPGGIVADPGPILAPDGPLLFDLDTVAVVEVSQENFSLTPETFWPEKSFPAELQGLERKKLGIDLALRGHEVRKLLFKGFGSWMFSAGHDPEEVFQEVCKGILARNRGRGAFDDRRSSFGHYVHNVCRCVLSNWHRREMRRRTHEQVGVAAWRDGGLVEVDAAEADRVPAGVPADGHGTDLVRADLAAFMARRGAGRTPDGRLAMEMIPLVADGLGRAEIADRLGPKGGKAAVARALSVLKRHAAAWAADR